MHITYLYLQADLWADPGIKAPVQTNWNGTVTLACTEQVQLCFLGQLCMCCPGTTRESSRAATRNCSKNQIPCSYSSKDLALARSASSALNKCSSYEDSLLWAETAQQTGLCLLALAWERKEKMQHFLNLTMVGTENTMANNVSSISSSNSATQVQHNKAARVGLSWRQFLVLKLYTFCLI